MASIVTLQTGWHEAYTAFGHRYWSEALTLVGPTVTRIAGATGVCRPHVYKKLKRFDVHPPVFPAVVPWKRAIARFGHAWWTALMESCDANVSRMARVSQTNRTDVYKKLKRYKVKLPKTARHYGGHRGNWGDLSNEEPQRATA